MESFQVQFVEWFPAQVRVQVQESALVQVQELVRARVQELARVRVQDQGWVALASARVYQVCKSCSST